MNVSTPSVRFMRPSDPASGADRKIRPEAQRCAIAESPAQSQDEEKDDAERREAARKAGRVGVQAEDPERSGVGPVQQRRLLEVVDEIQFRNEPVSAREHLAGDLGVPGLVRLEQERAGKLQKEQRAEGREPGDQDAAARERAHGSPPASIFQVRAGRQTPAVVSGA